MSRTKLAFLIAPLWVPLATALVSRMLVWPDPSQTHWVVIATTVGGAFAYAGCFVVGLPLFRLLTTRGLVSMWIAPTVGFAIGAVTWLAFISCLTIFLGGGPFGAFGALAPQQLPFLAWPGGLGALVGMTVWLITRPDRQSKAHV
jgi:hypothetical protein